MIAGSSGGDDERHSRHHPRRCASLIDGDRIVAVGKAADLAARIPMPTVVGGDQFVVTPGMVNTHIHITGEPLTRGYVPDDTPFEENVFVWLCRLYSVYTAAEERLSAQLAAVEMLRSGTTTFLEAGTIRFLDEVVDGLVEVGIRGRVGRWVWDLPPEPDVYRQRTDEAIGHLQRQLTDFKSRRRRPHRGVVDPRRPHDVLRPAVAGGAAAGHRARRRA